MEPFVINYMMSTLRSRQYLPRS